MRAGRTNASDQEIERRVDVRLERQAALVREDRPLRVWSVISEGTLRRQIGGPQTMRDQLLHLIEQMDQPNIDVQVLPFSAGAHPSLGSTFTILRFDEAEPLVFGNGINYSPEIEDPAEKQHALDSFDWLRATAESPNRSRRIIQEAADAVS